MSSSRYCSWTNSHGLRSLASLAPTIPRNWRLRRMQGTLSELPAIGVSGVKKKAVINGLLSEQDWAIQSGSAGLERAGCALARAGRGGRGAAGDPGVARDQLRRRALVFGRH